MRTWSYLGLVLAVLAKWFCGKVFADDLSTLCLTDPTICDALALSGVEDQSREKRFLRFGRALSGDGFLRFGRANYPFEDKRFLRFGRGDRSLDDLLHEVLLRVQSFEKTNGARLRRKRSVDTDHVENDETPIAKVEDVKRSVDTVEGDDKDRRFMLFDKKDDEELDEKRFMRFGREPTDEEKRFMRFGRDKTDDDDDLDKRFMRFGKAGDEKRFMRFGRDSEAEGDDEDIKEDDKRFMRFGKSDDDKRFMRFGRGGDEKRFMRFGRGDEDEKRFMRFGKKSDDKRFTKLGSNPDDKRFMRFGRGGDEKRFMRFGRGDEDEKRFMRFGKKSDDKRFMRFGKK